MATPVEKDDHGRRMVLLGARPATFAPAGDLPRGHEDWQQARPREIKRALERAMARPTGGWYVLDESRVIGDQPELHVIEGEELVSWRSGGVVQVAPNSCPHMGASLAGGCVERDRLVCPWHGLALGAEGHGAWRPFATHDDGVLTWVRLGPADAKLPTPVLSPRPEMHLAGVIRMDLRCAPEDVIANRLDPWHGTHLHRSSFARLRVIGHDEDVLRLRVAFRVLGPLCVEVDCTFHSPQPRSIVMTIVDGEGSGTVVETHLVPLKPGLTRMIEVTLASSPRPGFRRARLVAPLVRRFVEHRARVLWVDDSVYTERTYRLREQGKAALPDAVAVRGTP